MAAAFGDAGDDGAPGLDGKPAGGEIIQKEQGLSALNHQIVDAHGDEVDAHGIVAVEGDGDLELGAHPVGGRDQDGIAKTGRLEVEQGAETAKSRLGSASGGAGRHGLDRLDQGRPGIDVDAGLAIAAGVYGVLHGDKL